MTKSAPLKIIIIEADKFLSEIYKKSFEASGFKVTAVNDGEKGLKTVQNKKPNAVVLAVNLPKLNGFSILKILKKNKETKKIPVVLSTCMGQQENVREGLKLGATDYLIKAHCRPAEVVDKVKKILSK